MIGLSRLTPADHDHRCTFRGTGQFDPHRCERCRGLSRLMRLTSRWPNGRRHLHLTKANTT